MKSLFTTLLVMLFIACTTFAQKINKQVDSIIKREMQERQIPGLQVAVVQKGIIVFSKSYGLANIQDHIPVDQESIFAINSCTKVFTGVAIMQLVEAGKVRLDAPIANYIDSLPEAWKPVTIQQMLTHISGFPDLLKLLDHRTGGLGDFKNEQEVWEKLKTLPMEFKPGERFSYNQTNPYLLGKLIDKINGKPFAQVFSEMQFEPADMIHTLFGDSRDVIPHFAPTYFYRGTEDGLFLKDKKLVNNYYEFPYFRRAAAGLNSTSEDLANWVIALQQGKLLKSKSSLKTMWTPITFNNGKATPWALGWGLTKFRKQHPAIGMSGGGRAAFLIYPEDDLAVIVLTNLGGSYPEDILEEIAGCYVPEIVKADPITFIRTNLKKIGFDKAMMLVDQEMENNPQFKPNEFELNEWAYRMMAKAQLSEAKSILQLNVHLFPDSWNAYDSYGEVLLKAGDRDQAVKMYQQSLKLNPANEHAQKVLSQLR